MYRKYRVSFNKGKITVRTVKGHDRPHKRSYIPENFVYGTGVYIDETRKYPDYVHQEVWRLYELDRE